MAQQNSRLKSIVVTVTWNRLDLLKLLFKGLENQKDKNFGIIVVDNGSNDGSREFLISKARESVKSNIPIWTMLLKENTGFAVANNLALSFALEFLEFDYFILLNNDTIPEPDFIAILHKKVGSYLYGSDQKNFEVEKKLYPFLSKKNGWEIGSFAPLVENYYARGIVDAAGIKIYPDGSAINRGMGEKIYKFKREKEVFGPSGSAVLYLKKALLDVALAPRNIAILKGWEQKSLKEERIWSVGIDCKQNKHDNKIQGTIMPIKEFFASRYFAYFEDVDLAWRLRLRFWGCVYLPEAKVLHRHSATSRAYSPFKSFFVHRNQYFNILRDFPSYYLLAGLFKAIKRYFYLLQSIGKNQGPAARLAKNSSISKVFSITVKGWASVFKNFPGLTQEHYFIQSHRLISLREFREIIYCPRFHASLQKMIFETQDFLEAHKKNDAKDKDHTP